MEFAVVFFVDDLDKVIRRPESFFFTQDGQDIPGAQTWISHIVFLFGNVESVQGQVPEHDPGSNDLGVYDGTVVIEQDVFYGHEAKTKNRNRAGRLLRFYEN